MIPCLLSYYYMEKGNGGLYSHHIYERTVYFKGLLGCANFAEKEVDNWACWNSNEHCSEE